MSQWYAARTATRREKAAVDGLTERGFVTFLPMQTFWRSLARAKRPVQAERPLIVGYLFVLCEPEQFDDIREVEAVHEFVMATCSDGVDRPIMFPLSIIVGLQADEAGGLFDYTVRKRPPYRPRQHDRVKVVGGTWLNFVGRVLATPKGDRVMVMLEGPHGRGVTVPAGQLRAA